MRVWTAAVCGLVIGTAAISAGAQDAQLTKVLFAARCGLGALQERAGGLQLGPVHRDRAGA